MIRHKIICILSNREIYFRKLCYSFSMLKLIGFNFGSLVSCNKAQLLCNPIEVWNLAQKIDKTEFVFQSVWKMFTKKNTWDCREIEIFLMFYFDIAWFSFDLIRLFFLHRLASACIQILGSNTWAPSSMRSYTVSVNTRGSVWEYWCDIYTTNY